MWQMVHDKLAAGRVNDWPYQGVASSPLVEGDRVYYVSNRAELVCLDTQGFRDKENDGPVTDEKLTGEINGDVVWRFDMIEEVGSLPHNLANSSPVCSWRSDLTSALPTARTRVTSTFLRQKRRRSSPSTRRPGKLVWEDNSVSDRILHGQWCSPTVGTIGGVVQVIHGQGDGWIRGYEALTGKKLWEFDTNPKDSVWPKTRNEVISTPVVYEDQVYIANGQDPEHGEGVGHMYCIDATKRGDITKTGMVWHYDKIRRSISTPAIKDGIVYQPDFSGFLHALDAKTGQVYWTHDLFAAVWGSPLLIDGKLYLGDEDGDVVIMQEGKTKKVLAEINMGSSVYSTPVPANGVLYISNRNQLYALAEAAAGKQVTAQADLAAQEAQKAQLAAKPQLSFLLAEHSVYNEQFRLSTSDSRDLWRRSDRSSRRAGARTELSAHAARR